MHVCNIHTYLVVDVVLQRAAQEGHVCVSVCVRARACVHACTYVLVTYVQTFRAERNSATSALVGSITIVAASVTGRMRCTSLKSWQKVMPSVLASSGGGRKNACAESISTTQDTNM